MATASIMCERVGSGTRGDPYRARTRDSMLSGETATIASNSNSIMSVSMVGSDLSRFDSGTTEWGFKLLTTGDAIGSGGATRLNTFAEQIGYDTAMLAKKTSTTFSTLAENGVLAEARAWTAQVITYYVATDGDNGDDGSIGSPFATLDYALSQAEAADTGDDDVIIYMRGGTYRANSVLEDVTDIRVTVSVYQSEEVIISGSDIYSSWSDLGSNVYSHAWTNDWGNLSDPFSGSSTPVPTGRVLRREILFVNGTRLTPVLAEDDLENDTFWVDETGNVIKAQTTADLTDTGTNTVEVAIREELLRIDDCDCVYLKGLTFQHSSRGIQSTSEGAVILNNVKRLNLDNYHVQNNTWTGLIVYGTNSEYVNITNCTFNDNGGSGVNGTTIDNFIMRRCEAQRNNWRGDLEGFDDWTVAGVKLLRMRDAYLIDCNFSNNYARGGWFDYDNKRCYVTGGTYNNNTCDGFFVEASFGAVTLSNAEFNDNGWTGVRVHNSEDVTITDCSIRRNEISGVSIHKTVSRVVQDRDDSQDYTLYHDNLTVTDCVMEASDPVGDSLTVFGSPVALVDRGLIHTITYFASNSPYSTLSMSGNTYYRPAAEANEDVFKALYDPSEEYMTLAEWKTYTSEDADSVISTI